MNTRFCKIGLVLLTIAFLLSGCATVNATSSETTSEKNKATPTVKTHKIKTSAKSVYGNINKLLKTKILSKKLKSVESFHKSMLDAWEKLDKDFFIDITEENLQDYKEYVKEFFFENLDPHTTILSKTEYEDVRGIFFGVGIIVSVDPKISKERDDILIELEKKYFPIDITKPPYSESSRLELYKFFIAKNKFMERISPEYKKINRLKQSGNLGDKGLYLNKVVDMEGSGARLAGLTEKYNGWYIKSVTNGDETIQTRESRLGNVIRKMRGKNETKVSLVLISPDGKTEKTFNITRRPYNIGAQEKDESRLINHEGKKIGYFKLTSFSKTDDMGRVDRYAIYTPIEKLYNSGAQGMILDLRNNGGGFLRLGTLLADIFLKPNQLILTVKTKNGGESHYSRFPKFFGGPIVILINGGTASASEITTIILKELYKENIYLIGTKSFGKGSVQSVKNIGNGSNDAFALKLTIAKYYSPNGICVDGDGIEVDEVITVNADTSAKPEGENHTETKEDPAIKRAVEHIYNELK